MVSEVSVPIIKWTVLSRMWWNTCYYAFTERTLPKKFLCTSVRTIRSTGIYLFYEQYVDQQTCKDKAD